MTLSKRSQRKVDSIEEHASLLFVRHGFSGVTMEKIAQYANVSKVTLYKYFKDKQSLYEHLILKRLDQDEKMVKDIVTDLIPYEDKLRKIVQYHVETSLDRSTPNLDPDLILSIETAKQLKNHKAKMRRLRQKLYNQARMEEYLPDDLSDTLLDTLFHAMVDGLIAQEHRLARLEEGDRERLYDRLLRGFHTR
jgi:AcrR family transcriptional regulator